MNYNLELVTQTVCSLILSKLLNKCAFKLQFKNPSKLFHIHSHQAVPKKVYMDNDNSKMEILFNNAKNLPDIEHKNSLLLWWLDRCMIQHF